MPGDDNGDSKLSGRQNNKYLPCRRHEDAADDEAVSYTILYVVQKA